MADILFALAVIGTTWFWTALAYDSIRKRDDR